MDVAAEEVLLKESDDEKEKELGCSPEEDGRDVEEARVEGQEMEGVQKGDEERHGGDAGEGSVGEAAGWVGVSESVGGGAAVFYFCHEETEKKDGEEVDGFEGEVGGEAEGVVREGAEEDGMCEGLIVEAYEELLEDPEYGEEEEVENEAADGSERGGREGRCRGFWGRCGVGFERLGGWVHGFVVGLMIRRGDGGGGDMLWVACLLRWAWESDCFGLSGFLSR